MYQPHKHLKHNGLHRFLSGLLCCALLLSGALAFGGCSFPQHAEQPAVDSKQEQKEFDQFLDELFAREMSDSDTLSIHFSMEQPKDYGVTLPAVTWGETTPSDPEKDREELTSLQKELSGFSYKGLTPKQQMTYDTLKATLDTSLEGCSYTGFSETFSPMNGLQTQIPILLSEFDFHTRQDIEDYISLVEQSYDYISGCLDYEKKLAKDGYCLSSYSSKKVREQCLEFLAPSENCLIPVFEEKLKNFTGLTSEEITAYQTRHEKALTDSLIPAYQLIMTVLSELEGSRLGEEGLCSFPDGKDYYKYLVRSLTGSGKNVPDLIKMTEKRMSASLTQMRSLLSDHPELADALEDCQYAYSDPKDILNHLKDSMTEDFPKIDLTEYLVKSVPKSLESLSNPAFYLIPPIDSLQKQVIYINGSSEYAGMDLFPTLAHEGFPGHMYASYYYNSQNPHPVRSLLGPTGYHEGWAQYVENYSYQYSGLDDSLSALLALNSSYSYAVYARTDMGIHYEGWDLSDTKDYLSRQIGDPAVAEEIYYTLLDDPGVYLPYYIGYAEIRQLRDAAEERLGDDFSIRDFHEFFLSVGPTYFDVLAKHMEKEFLDQ